MKNSLFLSVSQCILGIFWREGWRENVGRNFCEWPEVPAHISAWLVELSAYEKVPLCISIHGKPGWKKNGVGELVREDVCADKWWFITARTPLYMEQKSPYIWHCTVLPFAFFSGTQLVQIFFLSYKTHFSTALLMWFEVCTSLMTYCTNVLITKMVVITMVSSDKVPATAKNIVWVFKCL